MLWYFVSIFVVFSLPLAGQTITCFFAFPAAVIMFLRNFRSLNRRELLLLFMLIILALISVIFGFGEHFLGERFKSWVLFVYSLSMTYAMRLELGRATPKEIAWVSGWLLFGILAAAILEVLGPLQPLSDAFRSWNNSSIYDANDRDLYLTGFLRPKVFTREPSYAAIGVAVFSLTWYTSTISRNKLLLFSAATAIALFLFRSPISVIAILPVVLIFLQELFKGARGRKHKFLLFLAVLSFLALNVVVYYVISWILEARNGLGGFWGDQSLLIRLYAPPRIAAHVIADAPFIGSGIGGRGGISTYVQLVFSDIGIETSFLSAKIEDSIPNAFWEHWIYFGAVGGALGAFIITSFFGPMTGKNGFVAAIFLLLLANSFGAYSSPRLWSYAVLAVIAIGSVQRKRFGAPQSK